MDIPCRSANQLKVDTTLRPRLTSQHHETFYYVMVVKGLILVKELEHNESVSENLVSEKSLSFGFGEFGLGKYEYDFQT